MGNTTGKPNLEKPDFVQKSITLNHYKRREIQEEMVREARDKEVAVSYSGKGYGKRPDSLFYPQDIIEMVKKRATSFHASEEIWNNPLNIVTGAKKQEIEALRKGWDLVIDIDCPYWKFAKINAWLIVKVLKEFGIKSISAKFSGNKGFHIGVPFEAFPRVIDNKETRNEFPDAPRRIALFLLDYISRNHIKVTEQQDIIFGDKYRISIDKLQELTGKNFQELTKKFCQRCGNIIKHSYSEETLEYLCPRCGYTMKFNSSEIPAEEYMQCPNRLGGEPCNTLMEARLHRKSLCSCGSGDFITIFDPLSIIDVDTILIASRHLYRMSYSMHEKSGLASFPINPDKIMEFKKEMANPQSMKVSKYKFLDRSSVQQGEAGRLLLAARDFKPVIKEEDYSVKVFQQTKYQGDLELLEEAVPEELFPPCIQFIFKGLHDGRQRALFILKNFLTSIGWSYELVEARIRKWNKLNAEELKEVILMGQLRYLKHKKQSILPPNCDNKMYYTDLRVCRPDKLCKRIKNPVQYAKLKARLLVKNSKNRSEKKKTKKSENSSKTK